MSLKKPEVSIITLTYKGNWWVYTENLVKQILKKTEDVSFEIIVVNNDVDPRIDKEFGWLKKQYEDSCTLKMVSPKKNLGFSGGNNAGVEIASGDFFLFLNDDVLIHNGNWLKKLMDAKKDSNIVGAQLIEGNSYTEFKGTYFPYLGGWCVLTSRDDFEMIGRWEEDFGPAYFEDVWFSIRAKMIGRELKQVNVQIEHLGSGTMAKLPDNDFTRFAHTVYLNKLWDVSEKKRIVFFYNGVGFVDADYEGRGVGGAEASLIQLTRQLAKGDWHVDVYNGTRVELTQNGVHYHNVESYNPEEHVDVFVLWRDYHEAVKIAYAKTKIFFSCDQATSGDWNNDIFPNVDKTICISPYHKDFLLRNYAVNKEDIIVMDLGIKEEDYSQIMPKVPGKLLFCSVPGRGLKYLAQAFPRIREEVPEASLYITSDYTLWGAEDPGNQEYVDMFRNMGNVHFLGKVPRKELVEHQLTAEIMAYPCDYDENFCIAAMECIASGTPPVTFNIGALKTTVGDSGIVLNGSPSKNIELFAKEVTMLLKDEKRRKKLVKEGKKRALTHYSWGHLGKKYEELFLDLWEKGVELSMHKCEICSAEFDTAYEMFKHRAKEHGSYSEPPKREDKTSVYIYTTKPVEISINNFKARGTELKVPKRMAGDIVRILKEAYGTEIIKTSWVL